VNVICLDPVLVKCEHGPILRSFRAILFVTIGFGFSLKFFYIPSSLASNLLQMAFLRNWVLYYYLHLKRTRNTYLKSTDNWRRYCLMMSLVQSKIYPRAATFFKGKTYYAYIDTSSRCPPSSRMGTDGLLTIDLQVPTPLYPWAARVDVTPVSRGVSQPARTSALQKWTLSSTDSFS
jgi:hypothetical protein